MAINQLSRVTALSADDVVALFSASGGLDAGTTLATLKAWLEANLAGVGGTVTAADITDASADGRAVLTAANNAAIKSLLSLSNVDNTSDANKPVSSAQASSIAAAQAAAIAAIPGLPSQAEAEAGTSTTARTWSAQRVAQAIAALGGSGSVTAANVLLALQAMDASQEAASRLAIGLYDDSLAVATSRALATTDSGRELEVANAVTLTIDTASLPIGGFVSLHPATASATYTLAAGTATVTVPSGATLQSAQTFDGTMSLVRLADGTYRVVSAARPVQVWGVAISDETTAITAGANKAKFRAPFAATVVGVRAGLSTAQTSGAIFTVDINEAGASILSTKLTIDNTEATSTTAAAPAVISDASIADDAELTFDVDQVGDGTAKGCKVFILVRPA